MTWEASKTHESPLSAAPASPSQRRRGSSARSRASSGAESPVLEAQPDGTFVFLGEAAGRAAAEARRPGATATASEPLERPRPASAAERRIELQLEKLRLQTLAAQARAAVAIARANQVSAAAIARVQADAVAVANTVPCTRCGRPAFVEAVLFNSVPLAVCKSCTARGATSLLLHFFRES